MEGSDDGPEIVPTRYILEREIGRGGMAIVYLAEDRQHQRKVAIKVLRPELSVSVGAERFKREISIVAQLTHPHIVPLHESGESHGHLYFVMPYVDGETLDAALAVEGKLSLARALPIARDVSEALAYAHERGIVHRDIKPRNILLTAGHAVVSDFGVAKALTLAAEDLTATGIALGTAGYMSPEQATGSPDVDARADIYSLGCVLYEMLTGQTPFSAANVQGMLAQHAFEAPPPPSEIAHDVPASVSDAILRALAKAPGERFRSVQEFMAAIEGKAPGHTVTRPAERAQPSRSRYASLGRVTFGAAVAVIAVATIQSIPNLWTSEPNPWPNNRPASVVVAPFHTVSSSASERDFAATVARDAIAELNRWEPIRAVPGVSLSGPMFDLGLTEPTFSRVDDAITLGRHVGVMAIVTVTAELRGDSAYVDAALYDVASGRLVDQLDRHVGPRANPSSLARMISRQVMGLSAVDASGVVAALTHTRNIDAWNHAHDGRSLLERWQLEQAENAFRNAIAIDSTFAMAHHRLAQTLYWQASEGSKRYRTVGTEIALHSAAALRHAAGLPIADSTHIRGFFAFQEGDFEHARGIFGDIVTRDSTDVYAWLMLGSVEYHDPWLIVDDAGTPRPRVDFNKAIVAFRRAVRLQPMFYLGYGHLFDIHRELHETIALGACSGFALPRDELVTPWENVAPQDQMPFCAVALDSIVWLTPDALTAIDQAGLASNVTRLFDSNLGLLKRWADYAPEDPKPLHELTRVVESERERRSAPEAGELAVDALGFGLRALALQTDTLAADFALLGALYLGAGDLAMARATTERAVTAYQTGSTPPPAFMANVYLALGQPARALAVLGNTPRIRRYLPTGVQGEFVTLEHGISILNRISVLGATGVTGPLLRASVDSLDRWWSAADRRSAQERVILRNHALKRIGFALAADHGALTIWGSDGIESRLWNVLATTLIPERGAQVDLTPLGSSRLAQINDAAQLLMTGIIAQQSGAHRAAISSLEALDTLVAKTRVLDLTWGIRPLSHSYLGESYLALGDTTSALDHYSQLSTAWQQPDAYVAPLLEAARQRLANLSSSGR